MRLFVTDIDDTLVAGESVSQEVRDAFARLRAAGWDVIVASGRSWCSAREHMEAIGVTLPSILYNGGRIMDPQGRPLHSILMDNDLANRVLRHVWTLPAELQISGDEFVSCREEDRETRNFFAAAGCAVRPLRAPAVDFPAFRVSLWMPRELMEDAERDLTLRFGEEALVCPGGPQYLDIQPRGVSKGNALDILLRDFIAREGGRPEIIVAAGDHRNDQDILSRADIAATPEDACPALLEEADIVFPSARKRGIRQLIDRLLSQEGAGLSGVGI